MAVCLNQFGPKKSFLLVFKFRVGINGLSFRGKAFHAKALLYNTLFINNVLCGWGTFIVATSCPLVGSCLVSLYGSRSFLLYAIVLVNSKLFYPPID